MTSISGLSSGLINSYEQFKSYKSELTTENMFQMLSLQVDGDGDTITKKQLDTYIESAEDGTIDISDKELDALKTIQEDWTKISGGKDSITFKDMEDKPNLLLKAVTGGISSNIADKLKVDSAIDDVDQYLIDAALNTSFEKDSSGSGVNSLLQTLLTGKTAEEDDNNANLIAKLINIISDFESQSTVETEA